MSTEDRLLSPRTGKKVPYGSLDPENLYFIEGDNEWSIVYDLKTGLVLDYGDTYNVIEFILLGVGVAHGYWDDEPWESSDWMLDSRTVVESLKDVRNRKTERLARQATANDLRQQAEELIQKADAMERGEK